MSTAIPPFKSVKQCLELTDGSQIVLCETEDVHRQIPTTEFARNLFRVDACGYVIWRVPLATQNYPHCFVDVRQDDDGKLIAYNFNCWEYEVDIDSGSLTKHAYLK